MWLPLRLRIGLENTKALRVATIQEAVRVFHPQVLLVDHVPVGIWGELLPSLQMLKRRSDAPTIVLGLRNILDAPEVTRALWEREGRYEAIRRYYDIFESRTKQSSQNLFLATKKDDWIVGHQPYPPVARRS